MEIKIDKLGTTDITWLANEYIHHERNRQIFLRRYLDGITLEALAEEADLSVGQIRNVLKKCMETVIEHIEIKGNVLRVVR